MFVVNANKYIYIYINYSVCFVESLESKDEIILVAEDDFVFSDVIEFVFLFRRKTSINKLN